MENKVRQVRLIDASLFAKARRVLLRRDSELNFDFVEFSLIFQIEIDFTNEDFDYFIDTLEEFNSIVALIKNIFNANIFIYETVAKNHFMLLKFFNNENDEDIIFNSFLIYKDPDPYAGDYCPPVYDYTSKIELVGYNLINSNLIEIIKSKLVKIKIPTYYVGYFTEYNMNKGDDDFIIKKKFLSHNCSIINTQTKVRRLGYLKLLSQFLNLSKKRSLTTIYKEFEVYCDNSTTNEQLLSYDFSKGVIKVTKSGVSAKPYIKFASEIGFVDISKNNIKLTKNFQVYLSISQEFSNNGNPFSLNKFEKLFFAELILKHDYLYISSIAKLLYIKTEVSFEYLKNIFKKYLLKNINDYIVDNTSFLKYEEKRKLKSIYNRINKWEKPEIYLEHILMPRLNWLADLGFADITDDNTFKLNEDGKLFFETLCIWMDLYTGNIIDCEKFLNKFYVKSFGVIFNNSNLNHNNSLEGKIKNKIITYVNDSFEKFKTFAPNRVTLSQAISYVKYKLYLIDDIVMDYDGLVRHIQEDLKLKYIFKFQKQYNDGYLQKRKT